MTKPSQQDLDAFAKDLDQVRASIESQIGSKDATYIRRLIAIQRTMEIASRILMVCGFISPFLWVLAVLMLAAAKILDNMEIGHNVMHGQYDWMNDPYINGRNYEWDIAGDGDSWRRYHNFEHHTYTNVIGKDRDYGYGLLRLSDDLPWRRKNLWQFITYFNLSVMFEWGIAYHELAAERVFMGKKRKNSNLPISHKELKQKFFTKIGKQVFKDYIFFPLLCWPVAFQVLVGNLIANIIRNIWTSTIIFCGHFTENAHTFHESDIENETRGEWYYRQILGSSNLTGANWFHLATGHLSFQIEHHLFPDIPAPRYRELAPQVQQICQKYNIPYNTGSFFKQYSTVIKRIAKHSFPDKPESLSPA